MVEAESQRWYHDWTVAAALVLVAAFLVLICILLFTPDKEPYYPGRGDPIVYWEVVEPTNPHANGTIDGNGMCMITGLILLGITLTPVYLSKRKFVVIPLMLLSWLLCIFTAVIAFIGSGEDTISLYHLDTVELTQDHYHLTGGDVSSLDMPYSRLLLYECDIEDVNCYSTQLDIYGGGWHNFDDMSLEFNEETNQLEVWDDGEVIYTVDADN